MDRRKFIKTTGVAGAAVALSRSSRARSKQLETDLLIIGSGFAGMWAAIAAADAGVKEILIVDKASIGRSSMSKMCAGATIYRFPEDDPKEWLRDVALANRFLSRQDLISQILDTSYSRYQKLEAWGVKYSRAPWGAFRMPSRGFKKLKMSLTPTYQGEKGGAAVANALLEQLQSRKIRGIAKTLITELIISDGRVSGAVGVNRLTGETAVIKAKAVILALADCSFRGNYACVDAVTGDGFALAYRAGARLTNMEFLCVNTAPPDYGFEGTGVVARYGGRFLNQDLEPFMNRYHPDGDKAEIAYITRAMATEIEKGNGPPLYLDMSRPPMRWAAGPLIGSAAGGWVKLNLDRLKEQGRDIFKTPQQWVAAIQTLRGGVRTDADFMSDLPGLFAAGMTQSIDPGLFNGWSTMRAMGSGELAGKAAARFLNQSDGVALNESQTAEAEARALEPSKRTSGIDPEQVLSKIQALIAPYPVCVKKTERSLLDALNKVKQIQDNDLPALCAADPHQLGKCHEAMSAALCAELFLRASLQRKETRGDHCRADHPERDDQNWLRWVNLKNDGRGGLEVSYEDVPLSSYPIQPGTDKELGS